MKSVTQCCVLILAATVIAMALRLPLLAQRPMHTDEAVHAIKFAQLLEEGNYKYDYHEYHGPTLNYFTLLPAWLTGKHNIKEVTEFTLRIVPVFFGILLIPAYLLLTNGITKRTALLAAIITAISPAFVFYSRYYIQEILLVLFTFALVACVYRFTSRRNYIWPALAGISAGLMHATKETCILAFAAMAAASLLVLLLNIKKINFADKIKPNISHIVVFLIFAAATSILFFSSFFTNWHGIIDSFKTWTTYFDRAAADQDHIHPWFYYFRILAFYKFGPGRIWSEAFVLFFAIIGSAFVLTGQTGNKTSKPLIQFILFYTLFLAAVYSAIKYKTPWCLLSFYTGMIILAAFGITRLADLLKEHKVHLSLFSVLIFAGLSHLLWQAYLANYPFAADPTNPYVYAHTSNDIYKINTRIRQFAAVHPDNKNTRIDIICAEHDHWPLPWYLRDFPNVAWLENVDNELTPAPIIIASPQLQKPLLKKLYQFPPPGQKNLYLPLFNEYIELRPGVELRGFVTKSLYDKYLQSQGSQQQNE